MALDRPAALVASGQLEEAVDAYETLAHTWAPASIREEAHWRAAMLVAVELDQTERAIELMRSFEDSWPDSAHRPEALAHLAHIWLVDKQAPKRAAALWEEAASIDQYHPDASRWLLDAGSAHALAGQPDRAAQAYKRASKYPNRAAAAWMALARLRLDSDAAGAYEAYNAALSSADTGPEKALARLGREMALDRLERGWDTPLADGNDGSNEDTGLGQTPSHQRQRLSRR